MTRRWLRRAGPWLTPALVAAEGFLVWSGLLSFRTALVVGIAFEALVAVTVLVVVLASLRRFRSSRAAGVGGWQAIEDALSLHVPRRLARLMVLEPRLWVCLARWAARRHDGRRPHAYSYHRAFWPLLAGLIGLVVIEGAIVEAVLAMVLPGTGWVWVAAGVHLYALGWLVGLWASLATRPHLLGTDALHVRDGVFNEVTIPYSAICDGRLVRGSHLGRSGFKIDPQSQSATLAFGDTTVVVELDPPATLFVNGTSLQCPVATLALTVDRPGAFVLALSQLRSADGGSRAIAH